LGVSDLEVEEPAERLESRKKREEEEGSEGQVLLH
jgi:hypothetical protein